MPEKKEKKPQGFQPGNTLGFQKKEITKDVRHSLRMTKKDFLMFKEASERLKISVTDILVTGGKELIDKLEQELKTANSKA